MGYLKLLDEFEKERRAAGQKTSPTLHDAMFAFAVWLEKNAAQQSVQRTGGMCAECGRPAEGHDKIGVRHAFTPASR